jgi:C_GCAxxG_C_C family probable redox protein
VLAVGEVLWGQVEDRVRRMTCGLAGGVGGSHEELCGALSGGALLIASLYGRTSADENDDECNRLVCVYRERFIEAFGTSRCCDIRESGYGSEGRWPCSTLVERATIILLDVLGEGA